MKILFAVNNEKTSKAISKKYQNDYKEVISPKNVYYFNAIIKELQKDKSYDRIVISEDLEPFSSTNYDQIDKFIFDKLDSISDEASSTTRPDIPIILICSDRRAKSDDLLVKLFSIGIYDALIGKDRNVETICKLLKIPRTKKEAKIYYNIDSEDVSYQAENENDVSEEEIQSILAHYKRIGKNNQKILDSFDSIASQYTDAQLKLIVSFLPVSVKAVLEEQSSKYQSLMFGTASARRTQNVDREERPEEQGLQERLLSNGKREMRSDVIIPSAVNTARVKRVFDTPKPSIPRPTIQKSTMMQQPNLQREEYNSQNAEYNSNYTPNYNSNYSSRPTVVEAQTRAMQTNNMNEMNNFENNNQSVNYNSNNAGNMGNETYTNDENSNMEQKVEEPKKRRGRPRKNPLPEQQVEEPKKRRGRPRKNPLPEEGGKEGSPQVNQMPGFEDNYSDNQTNQMPGFEDNYNNNQANQMPGFEEDYNNNQANQMPGVEDNYSNNQANQMPGFEDDYNNNQINQMPGFEDDYNNNQVNQMPGVEDNYSDNQANQMPGFEDDYNNNQVNQMPGVEDNYNNNQTNQMPGVENNYSNQPLSQTSGVENNYNNYSQNTNIGMEDNGIILNDYSPDYTNNYPNYTSQAKDMLNTKRTYSTDTIDSLLTREKKIVTFIGTSKNGVSFLVNNLAESLSRKGINVAVLDTTKNRNSYYIYTENEESLRQIAEKSMVNLINGVAAGITVNKNLTVYTALPDSELPMDKYEEILSTLVKNHTLVLIDCDFNTDFGYFAASQEIYLVQSMDILTIQPLTAFLRDLQSKNIFQPQSLRIVINKELPVKTLTVKTIIGGLSMYNDPSMSFMRELFNRETAKYCTIPFEMQTYSKYLEGLVNCKISLNGYSKEFLQALRTLENMVYPVMDMGSTNSKNSGVAQSYEGSRFSNEMNSTLQQMKKNY